MTRRIETIRTRLVLAGLALALLGAVMLLALPDGPALADTNRERCANDGAVADAANKPGLVSDCAVLLDVKKTLQGKGGRELNWSASRPISQWDGVSIGEFHGGYGIHRTGLPNRVTELDLAIYSGDRTKKLKGKIPKQLGDLSELRGLNLFGNELHGKIRPHLGNLSELIELVLSVNNLSGKIPKRLGDLSELMTLSLDGNNLSGRLPKWIGRLSKLQYMFLRYNHLTGSIPKELGELPKLRSLELYQNQLTGCVPVSLKNIEYFGHTWMNKDNPERLSFYELREKHQNGEIPNPFHKLRWCSEAE